MAGDLIIDKVAASSTATKISLMRAIAKAWANLNAATPALRDSLNIAGITDHGVGDFTFSLTAAMANTNFISMGNPTSASGNNPTGGVWSGNAYATVRTTGTERMGFMFTASGPVWQNHDPHTGAMDIKGDLA